ncbi:DNA polymerase-4 [Breoghania corrubedonensis]|uniref:DNA polymerase IV n=1 Tax=Breoghania corrubedonensis TaxID=665038 RepID=A0A2T5VCL4_9HYPH|nr:DNA polymerase IV [Breoghania corrubedonensis]PTW61475.1 DNA polymerase-4 [Breoghania corrubedonensis]
MQPGDPIPGRTLKAFCRDCLAPTRPGIPRCPSCGSPRIVAHEELGELALAHIDCDAFYASIEKRDDPSLADKPLIIGGGRRGVVSTACYIARISGVHSAMPMFKALEACPDAVVLPPDMEKYGRVGREIRTMMRELTPLVEPISIDEAFLDLTGTERLHHAAPAETLARFAARVEHEVGITVSVGLSHNKFLAKIASDMDKPRGFSVIGRAETVSLLAGMPVSRIWGVGKALEGKLAAEGIRTIAQLQAADETELAKRYGAMGLRLARLARGRDERKVTPDSEAKSVSAETTFNTDISDPAELVKILRRLSEKVSYRLKKAGIAGRTVTLKLKTPDFRTLTRSRQLADPTQLADRIFRIGRELLAGETDGRRFRLLGIGVADLSDGAFADPADLVDEAATRAARAEHAVDSLREKFGRDAVELGLVWSGKR